MRDFLLSAKMKQVSSRSFNSCSSSPSGTFHAGAACGLRATALPTIAQEFVGWAPELTTLITSGETKPVARPLHTLPLDHTWEHVPGVTLVGEAVEAIRIHNILFGENAPNSLVDFFTGMKQS